MSAHCPSDSTGSSARFAITVWNTCRTGARSPSRATGRSNAATNPRTSSPTRPSVRAAGASSAAGLYPAITRGSTCSFARPGPIR